MSLLLVRSWIGHASEGVYPLQLSVQLELDLMVDC